MDEMTATLWIAFLFALRFALPLGIVLGGSYLVNSWFAYMTRHEKSVKTRIT